MKLYPSDAHQDFQFLPKMCDPVDGRRAGDSPHGGARADSMAGPGVGVVGVPAKDSAPGNAS